MYRGDDRDFPFTITRGGLPLDLTAATCVFSATTDIDETASFSLSSADGGITIAADQVADKGEVTVHIPASATVDFTDGATLLCDIETTIAGDVFTWPEAVANQSALIRLKVRQDVTVP
jgi:hypothetical protein